MASLPGDAEGKIRAVLQRWFLTEPVLFAVLLAHRLVADPRLVGWRVGAQRLEYNPDFVKRLAPENLREALRVEAVRILLLHPYERRKPNGVAAYMASNLALGEQLRSPLPLPRAITVFGSHDHDCQYYEYYYDQLTKGRSGALAESQGGNGGQSVDDLIHSLYDSSQGPEATARWDRDELAADMVADAVRQAEVTNGWGTVSGGLRATILANLSGRVDYRAMLRAFRASVLSSRRILTRLRPNRRYDFDAAGSRREFSTKLLLAIDVSGSMSNEDLAFGCGVVRGLFRYGVAELNVLSFDTEIQGAVLALRRARNTFVLTGRGGTDFDPVMRYVEDHPGYDGVIVFTDGVAPVPRAPTRKGGRPRVFWLFTRRETYEQMRAGLARLGPAAYLKR